MKKEEKTELTKEKIINAAIIEFGLKGYEGASLNNICNDNGISKGLIYHNFKSKDEIYLICVRRCFDMITAYLQEQNVNSDMHQYMELRFRFFSEHPVYARIFFESVLQSPKHLIEEIKELKKDFDELNIKIYRLALSKLTLRDSVTEQEALEYYSMVQNMFHGLFQYGVFQNEDYTALIDAHETKLAKILDLMLYGIAKEGKE
ncbi:TetR/AcrR family transcriptional regulator [Lachnoclostridium phytofermentans]|uniref:Transcriptional regulator, TetR family n=1 Tax=Lachnoclostridium phytofermentans (strain ATCC 700394 / DSM 18823 / ISDg) TaxID=357809 RepID=A9KJE8_LACP7|nr:TetR/AcrR family transcriptional regulator [Lachnoclostridium phytofermentans]ABX43968.1 transcriptional regulator, TetR family [Lachnoclostridium phytofermentans ISDg]